MSIVRVKYNQGNSPARLSPKSELASFFMSVNIDNSLINGVVFIDLKKAIDTIDHQIVLRK